MNMKSLLNPGSIAGVLGFLGMMSVAFGKPALGGFLSDPATAGAVTSVISGVVALGAGFMKGLEAK